MFNIDELNLAFKPVSDEPQLVLIPVSKEFGVIAVVKSLGNGKAACVAFSPATSLANPFQGYRPTFLRKMITTDLPMREGRWTPLSLDKPSALTLRAAVAVLLKDFDNIDPETIKEIDMRRPTNVSSSPEIASMTYVSPDRTRFEDSLGHLVGLEFTIARSIAKRQAELHAELSSVKSTEPQETTTTEESPIDDAASMTRSATDNGQQAQREDTTIPGTNGDHVHSTANIGDENRNG